MRLLVFSAFLFSALALNAQDSALVLVKTISGNLSPKSIVHNGKGLFFAQNMMYRHTITVFNRRYEIVKTISDEIDGNGLGFPEIGKCKGAPVECCFNEEGSLAFVSNYAMEGENFSNPGCDGCSGNEFDKGYVYCINTEKLNIERIYRAGSVPKYLCLAPDQRHLLVSNWSSSDVSLIDLKGEKETKNIHVGKFPRGLVIDKNSEHAYVAIMGSTKIKKIKLSTGVVSELADVGKGPRHLQLSPDGKYLYCTLNNIGSIARVDLKSGEKKVNYIGSHPRSMIMDKTGQLMYVVLYGEDKMVSVQLPELTVVKSISTGHHPIGITLDQDQKNIWVANYSGSITVVKDPCMPTDIDLMAALEHFPHPFEKVWKTVAPVFNTALPEKTEVVHTIQPTEKPKEEKKETAASETEIHSVVAHSTTGSFFIITGSFKEKSNAERQVKKLRSMGYSAQEIERSKGMTYAAIGRFTAKTDAEKILPEIRDSFNGSWVWRRD